MTIDLYLLMASPPARSVLIVARILNVPLNIIEVDLMNGQHRSDEYAKINPRKTVPAINDNGYFLGESRAIMMYLCNQYGGSNEGRYQGQSLKTLNYSSFFVGQKLYPKDAKERGQIDRALFLSHEIYEAGKRISRPMVYEGKVVPEDAYTLFNTLMSSFDTLIGNNPYIAGRAMTIADISSFVDICYFRDLPCIDLSMYTD